MGLPKLFGHGRCHCVRDLLRRQSVARGPDSPPVGQATLPLHPQTALPTRPPKLTKAIPCKSCTRTLGIDSITPIERADDDGDDDDDNDDNDGDDDDDDDNDDGGDGGYHTTLVKLADFTLGELAINVNR